MGMLRNEANVAAAALALIGVVGGGSCGSTAGISTGGKGPEGPAEKPKPPTYRSHITVFDLRTRQSTVVLTYDGLVEAPNWSRDGSYLLVNTGGDLFRLRLETPEATLERVQLGVGGYRCNNDHDLSPDGGRIAFSADTPSAKGSQVFVSSANGSSVSLVTPVAPSYFHGWSPDGKWLAFVAERGDGRFELYRVPAAGGAEERLTFTGGYDDGPEYTPDGRYIYFNSNRGGRWNIWRMPVDGAGSDDARAEQITSDAPEDWFPHISPDSRWIVMLSFPPGTKGHDERMAGMQLRLMSLPGDEIGTETPAVIVELFGGQGSINVSSWAPDANRFAYVAFEPM